MKKIYISILFILFSINSFSNEIINKYEIQEGLNDAKIKIYVFESLTCPHCASFHKDVYPELKKNYIDKGIVEIYFKSFPLDLAGLNAAKITHCLKKNERISFLHHLYETQEKWLDGSTIDEINKNIESILIDFGIKDLDFKKCLLDTEIEDMILSERIDAAKRYKVKSTPTVVINEKKFDKTLDYRNLKKAIEKLI